MKKLSYMIVCILLFGCNLMSPGNLQTLAATEIPVNQTQFTQTETVIPSAEPVILTPTSLPPENQNPPAADNETALRDAVAAALGANAAELNMVVSENTGTHARGGVENGYFLAAKIDGEWQVVATGQGAFDCPDLMQYNFPESMIPECYPKSSSDTQPPSNTPPPAAANQPPPNSEQIYFKNGGTSAYDHQIISAGQNPAYIVSVAEGQTMIVGVSSSNNDVYLDIQGLQYGQQLLSHSEAKSDWSGILPDTQTYLITLSTTNPSTGYFFGIEIPANVQFESGKNSITIDGYIDVHEALYPDLISRVSYLVYASASQTMMVNITSPHLDSLSLGIYGQADGQPYKRYEVKGTSGSLELPETQGYYIKVFSTGGVSTNFTMEITIQ